MASGSMMINRCDRMIFACDVLSNRGSELDWAAEVTALTTVRHREALATGAPDGAETLGVGALVRDGGPGVAYIFALMRGQVDLPSEIEWDVKLRYGVHDHQSGTTTALQVGRNDRCPCGSGNKYKRCHGA